MFGRHPKPDSIPLINFCVRLTPKMKAALQRRAAERSEREGIEINAGQIVREMVSAGLAATLEVRPQTIEERLFEELLVAVFFTRRALAVLLKQNEVAQDLLTQSRAELERRKRGGK